MNWDVSAIQGKDGEGLLSTTSEMEINAQN